MTNNEAFMKLKIDCTGLTGGKIVVGFNTLPGGMVIAKNIGINANFLNKVDYILTLDLKTDEVKYYVAGSHDVFLKKYYEWLYREDNYDIGYDNIDDIIDPNNGIFTPFQLLVKIPLKMTINGVTTKFPHRKYKLEFNLESKMQGKENLALVKKDKSVYTINIPYNALGYSNPAKHEKYISDGTGKELTMHYIDDYPIDNIEIFYSLGGNEIKASNIQFDYTYDKWEIPTSYCIKPKQSFNALRKTFGIILDGVVPDKFDGDVFSECTIPIGKVNTIHDIVVKLSFGILFIVLSYIVVIKTVINNCGYCYTCKREDHKKNERSHLKFISFILLIGLCVVYYFEPAITTPEFNSSYV